ncbi:MAG: hypothetical protein FWD66_03840 [Paludibacter sp.]|nr:hypothetical protein [Paludibacter sp.]
MKAISFFSIMLITVLITVSCVGKASYDKLKSQNDSLQNIKQTMVSELDDYYAAMTEISDNFDKIKGTENVIAVSSQGELKGDRRTKVINDLEYINDLISTNREKIADLQSKLQKSNFASSQLHQTVTRLTNELNAAQERLTTLEDLLQKKDSQILSLNTSVDSLNQQIGTMGENISSLENEKSAKQHIIDEQTYELNSAYYAIGTGSELKNEKILSGGGLFSKAKLLKDNFNKNYFTRIDISKTKQLPLNASKVQILTNHPATAYVIEKANPADKNDKTLILKINNQKEFWSLSNFLVVEVK